MDDTVTADARDAEHAVSAIPYDLLMKIQEGALAYQSSPLR
jgi:hypothetical protein